MLMAWKRRRDGCGLSRPAMAGIPLPTLFGFDAKLRHPARLAKGGGIPTGHLLDAEGFAHRG